MPLQHGSRVPTNVPNQQGTYRSAMQRRCDMIKVFCEGNSWKQNVEEIIEKMMGFLEVLLQLMITSQCLFFKCFKHYKYSYLQILLELL